MNYGVNFFLVLLVCTCASHGRQEACKRFATRFPKCCSRHAIVIRAKEPALVARSLRNASQWINLYPVESEVRFAITYPLDSDLSVS